jgi:hypothetical protein
VLGIESALGQIADALGMRASELMDAAETWPSVGAPASFPSRSVAASSRSSPDEPVAESVSARFAAKHGGARRGEVLRELLEVLHSLPTEDLERLAELARALRA